MIPNIKSTSDYSQFKDLTGNRDVMQNRVNSLKISILKKNKLHLNPIIVDTELSVIDGQHRLSAAEELKLPIYYMVDYDATKDDIIRLNTHRHNWNLKDYIYYYYIEGYDTYGYIQDLITKYIKYCPSFTPVYTSLIYFCHGNAKTFPGQLKNGTLILKNTDTCKRFLEITMPRCKAINSLIKSPSRKISYNLFFSNAYIFALCTCFRGMTEKEYNQLWKCIDRDYLKFTSTISPKVVRGLFSDSYNHMRSTRRFDFSKLETFE